MKDAINAHIIDMTKDITIAKLQSSNSVANKQNGKDTADFMQAIYDKLVELRETTQE